MKKIISICLCVIMLLATLPCAVFAEETYDAKFGSETIKLFEAIGILDESDPLIQAESLYVSRAEVARMLIRLLGYGGNASNMVQYSAVYEDIGETTEFNNEILLATKLGLFGSEVSSYFYPTAKANVSWATQAIARVLGYGLSVDRNPGIVNTLGLLKNIQGSANGSLRRDDLLQIISNAMNVQVLEIVGITDGGVALKADKDQTLLTVYFNVFYKEAVMEADSFTAVFGQKTKENEVRFGNVTYKVPYSVDTKNLVGTKLRYYYKEVGDNLEIVYLEKYKNTEVALNAAKTTYDYSKNQYVTYIDGDEEKFPLELQTMVAYNGLPCFDKDKIKPATGQITVIDNDGDGLYEVVIIREFVNVIVKAVNASMGMIYDMVDSNRNINADGYENFYLYSEDGELIELSELKADVILTVYESLDGTSAEAYVSSKAYALPLEAVNEGEGTLVADGVSYKFSADYRLAGSNLNVGQKYSLYLNYWNEVAYLTPHWSFTPFYLLETSSGSRGLSTECLVKGMLDSGEIKVYDLADKVEWYTYEYGKEYIKKEEAFQRLNNRPGDIGKANRQLLMINVTPQKKIREIVIAYEATTPDATSKMASDYPLIHLSHYMDISYWPKALLSGQAAIFAADLWSWWLPFSGNSTCEFIVPFNDTTSSYTDDDIYTWTWARTKSAPSRNVNTMNVYVTSKDKAKVDYIVSNIDWTKDGTIQTYFTDGGYLFSPFLVTDVVTTVDETTGDPATVLYLATSGGTTSAWRLSSEDIISREKLAAEIGAESGIGELPSDFTGIKPGDIIAAQTGRDGKLNRIRMVYDGKNQRDIHPPVSSSNLDSTSDILAGKIVDMHDGMALLEITVGEGIVSPGTRVWFSPGSTLVEYDMRTRKARQVSGTELQIGSEVVSYMRYKVVSCNYIYKNID